MNYDVISHYDLLIDENNDPVNDPDELKKYMDKWDGETFFELLELSSCKSVLEIGVGTGRLAVRTASFCKSFYGVDISPKTIDRAKENLSMFENVSLICSDFLTAELYGRFDIIYSSLTFMHIMEKQRAFDKVFELLNDKGRFVLSVDKNTDSFIDMGSRRLRIYPDSPDDVFERMNKSGFGNIQRAETEFAYIFAGIKND